MQLSLLLSILIPVVLGALIGYVTNDIAIKMLFRPLEPKYIWGCKIPLTPGILPKNRKKLASSLGKAVSRELLNAEVLRQRFADPLFKKAMRNQVTKAIEEILGRELRGLSISPAGLNAIGFEDILRGLLSSLADSAGFEARLREFMEGLLASLLSLKLESLYSLAQSQDMARRAVAALCDQASRERLRKYADTKLQAWLAGDTCLADSLPLPDPGAVESFLRAVYPRALDLVLSFAGDPELRRQLAEQGRGIVHDLLGRLNAIQRFLVSAAQYDKAISADMEKTIADLLRSLEALGRRDANRDALIAKAVIAYGQIIKDKPAELLARYPGLRNLANRALDTLDHLAASSELRTALEEGLSQWLDSRRDNSLAEVWQGLSGQDLQSCIATARPLEDYFLAKFKKPEALAAYLSAFTSQFLVDCQRRSLTELLGLSGRQIDSLSDYVTEKALVLVSQKTIEILATLDVGKTVEDRINQLDMASLEKIILDVMREQFKWINIFGALLGGLIGLVQALVSNIV